MPKPPVYDLTQARRSLCDGLNKHKLITKVAACYISIAR
jgi:hypothetical protein